MEPRESHKYMKWCNDNQIIIYPLPAQAKDNYRIVVERNGIASLGEKIFENNPKPPTVNVWDQIRLLYKMIYQREFKQEEHEKKEPKI